MDYLLTNAYAYLSFDNMDDFYFPSKGTNLYAEFSLLGNFKEHSHLSPALLLKMHHVFPVASRTALLFDLHGRALLDAEYPEVKITHVGGEPYSQCFNYHFPFVGLAPVTLAERYMLIGLTGVRFRMNKSQYASLLFNAMYQSDDKSAFKNGHMIYGGGIKYAIRTMFGPVDVTIGYSGYSGKPSFSANFGYWF
jgi:NTE family protein